MNEMTLAQQARIDGDQFAGHLVDLLSRPYDQSEPPEATLAALIVDLTEADKASFVYDRLAGFCEVVAPLLILGIKAGRQAADEEASRPTAAGGPWTIGSVRGRGGAIIDSFSK